MSMRIGRLSADAFITMHSDWRFANRWMDSSAAPQKLRESTNGWGAIYYQSTWACPVHVGVSGQEFQIMCCVSVVRPRAPYTGTQLISLAMVSCDQFDCIVCLVDNTAAEHVLNKRDVEENPA